MGELGGPEQPAYEYGLDCILLVPDLWEAGKCPKYIQAKVTGVLKCDAEPCNTIGAAPNGHVFILEQDDDHPCRWIGRWGLWECHFYGDIDTHGHSGLLLFEMSWGVYYFYGISSSQSQTSWSNLLACDINICGYEGNGVIF
jgi:hypothetical protein